MEAVKLFLIEKERLFHCLFDFRPGFWPISGPFKSLLGNVEIFVQISFYLNVTVDVVF